MKKRICASLLCFVLGISLVGCTIPGLESKKVTRNVDVDVDVDDDDDDIDIDIDDDDDVDIDVDDDDDDVDPEPPAPTYKGYYDGQPDALSENLMDFQIEIDGDIMQFPLMVSDLYDLGYEFVETRDIDSYKLPAQHYTWGDFRKGKNDEISFYINNESINTQVLKNCLISGITLRYYSKGEGFENVTLAGGIKASDLDPDNIMTVFGTPNDYDEGDNYVTATFKVASYQDVTFRFHKGDEGTYLSEIQMQNFIIPEDYDIGEVDENVPEIVSTYVAPEAISDNYRDYNIEIDGVIYELPVPLSVLLENGFKVDRAKSSSDFCGGYSEAMIYLTKGNATWWCTVYNYYENATAIENCYVASFDITSRQNVSVKTCFDVQIGDSYDDVIAALDGYDYAEGGSTYKNIKISDPDNPYSSYYYFVFSDKGILNEIEVVNKAKMEDYLAERGFEY